MTFFRSTHIIPLFETICTFTYTRAAAFAFMQCSGDEKLFIYIYMHILRKNNKYFFSKECLLFNLYMHSLIKSISAWRVRSWTRSPRLVVSSFNHFLLTKTFDVSCIHACCDSLLWRNIVESIKKWRTLMHLWIHMERFKSANFSQEITYKRYL